MKHFPPAKVSAVCPHDGCGHSEVVSVEFGDIMRAENELKQRMDAHKLACPHEENNKRMERYMRMGQEF
jgi:hypothetical protein